MGVAVGASEMLVLPNACAVLAERGRNVASMRRWTWVSFTLAALVFFVRSQNTLLLVFA